MKPIQSFSSNEDSNIETLPVPISQSNELSKRIGEGIVRSMDSLNRAADKLISSMEKSEEFGEIVGFAETMATTVEAQAKMVVSVADAMKSLSGKENK